MPTQASEYHTTSIYPNLDIKSICHVPEGYKEHKRISEDGLDIWTFLFDFPNPNSHFNSTKPVVTDPRALTTSSVDGETVNRATSWTFDEVKVRSEKLGRILQRKYGLGPRDVVGILAGNGIGFVTMEYAALWAYGSVDLMCPAWRLDQLKYELNDSKAKVLAIEASFLFSHGVPAALECGIPLENIILLDYEYPIEKLYCGSKSREHSSDIPSGFHFPTAEELLSQYDSEEKEDPGCWGGIERMRMEDIRLDTEKDVAILVSTSGTTGRPKAVMLSHKDNVIGSLQTAVPPCTEWGRMEVQEKYISLCPWYHQAGQLYGLHVSLWRRVENICMFEVDFHKMLEYIERYRPKEFMIYPPIAHTLATCPSAYKYDLSSLQSMIVAGATVPQATIRAWDKRFTGKVPLRQAMGATEAATITMMQPLDCYEETKGSVGRLVPHVRAKLLPINLTSTTFPTTAQLSTDTITSDLIPGELYITTPTIMLGYLNEPTKTEETIAARKCLRTNITYMWYRTGDLAMTMNNGIDYYHLGRVKDLIWFRKRRTPHAPQPPSLDEEEENENAGESAPESMPALLIRPVVLEDILGKHPVVQECAVVGIQNDTLPGGPDPDVELDGLLPRGYVVLKKAKTETGGERERSSDELEKLRGELVRFVDDNVGGGSGGHDYMRLRGGVEFVGGLPKNIAGKVLRGQLKGETDAK